MEDIRKHSTIKLITPQRYSPPSRYIKYSSRPEYESTIVYSHNLIGLKMSKSCVTLNKPIYLGQAILDNSKLIM
jgi:hypothetical protein